MLSSHSTLMDSRPFTDAGQRARPVVHVLTEHCSERETVKGTLSGAGFHVSLPAFPRMLPLPSAVFESTCLLVDSKMLPLFAPLEQRILPVICLTAEGDVATTVQAMRAGAIDVLARPLGARLLVDAVRNALDVSAASLRRATDRRRLEQRYAALSQREQEVMGLVTTGLMNKQVAHELRISEITVKAHRGRMMRKMDARSLAGLVQMANRLGLTTAGVCELHDD